MTVTTSSPAGEALAPREDLVSLTIDGFEVAVPKGTLVIRAAELLGIQVPRFCDHPLLDPVGACRQCLVEVVDDGNGRGMPKPQASCTIPVTPGMVVKTQITSPVADKAQQGIMEFLLINHPLDCPICDKGGECPLQNQAMSNGRSETRFVDVKRTFPKPINISAQVLLDRERCVLCARCTRFSAQVAGDPFIELLERGALQQVGIYTDQPFESYFSGNTVQICPVGALTSAKYRFRARPFDLVSTPTVCEHCSSGCALRADHRRGAVMRRQAGDDPEVNEEWNCDKGRWAFQYSAQPDRLTQPLVRDADGVLQPTSWSDALDVVARGLIGARGRAGVLVGGRLPLEDAYAYAKFARTVLETNDIDFRARTHSAEEADFLAARVAGTGLGVTYRDLEHAHTVLLAGLEPEEEVGIVFLRLRKAARRGRTAVFGIAALASPGLAKAHGTLLPTVPGDEAAVLDALGGAGAAALGAAAEAAATGLRRPGAVILVGERLGTLRGGLSAAVRL
ncbi:MAG: NADH-quinone oxidoreductase subunit G, partial [Actinomycetota bacterium]|nr:NADH-quinone oxidoreductase subunit G [Actinomycetota bacterium]